MEKEFWGKRVGNKFRAGEKQIDAAVVALMEVVSEVQQAQADLAVSAVATNPTLAKVMEAIMHLQEARTDMVSGHRRIEQLGNELGIRTTANGPIYKGIDRSESVEAELGREAQA